MECLEKAQPRNKTVRNPEVSDEEEEEERLFQVQRDYRMATILQEALSKRNQVSTLMTERCAVTSVRSAQGLIRKALGSYRLSV